MTSVSRKQTTSSTRSFSWRFRSVGELQKALEEYTAMIDVMLQPPISKPPGENGAVAQQDMDMSYRIMAQNREIDRRMERLLLEAPLYARLLHWYYRVGNSSEADGWRIAARRSGLPTRRRMHRGQDLTWRQFELVLDFALKELFHVH